MAASDSDLLESTWFLEEIGHVTHRRSGAVTWVPFLSAPHEVRLSRDGVFHFQWYRTDRLRNIRSERDDPGTSEEIRHTRSSLHTSRDVDPHLWKDFIALASAQDRQIRTFANKWGPLRYKERQPLRERLSHWRKYIEVANAILRCSVALRKRRAGSIEDWKVLEKWLDLIGFAERTSRLQEGDDLARRYVLAQALNLWFSRAKGNSLVGIQNDKLVIVPAVNSLFGIIGVQLAYHILGASQMLVCHHCQRSFTPRRKPSTGRRVFCIACRRNKKPQMHAMRDLRARQRAPAED